MSKEKDEFPSEKDLKDQPKKVTKEKPEKTKVHEEAQTLEFDFSKKIAELTDANSALEDRVLRLNAEIQNMQTRQKKEVADLLKYEGKNIIKEILPAVDNLSRALQASDNEDNPLSKGVKMTLEQLQKTLTDAGVVEIGEVGTKFDPNLEQAVQTVPATDENPADTIVQLLQPGYMLKDRLIRPAMVVVAQ